MKTALNLDVALLEAARAHAAKHACTLAEVVELALCDFLVKCIDSSPRHPVSSHTAPEAPSGMEPSARFSVMGQMPDR